MLCFDIVCREPARRVVCCDPMAPARRMAESFPAHPRAG